MTITAKLLAFVAAVVFFVIAFLIAVGAISGNHDAFADIGLVFFAAGFIVP